MPASIKTVLKIDDKELKAKLAEVTKYYKNTYNAWAAETEKLSQKDKLLTDQKKMLAMAMRRVSDEKAKGAKADKEVIAANTRLIAQIKDTIRVYGAERAAIVSARNAKKAEAAALQSGIAQFQKEQNAREKNIESRKKSIKTIAAHDKAMTNLANTTIRYLRWAGTIAGVLYATNRAWDLTLGKGIQINRMMEDNTYGIAAIISANTQMELSNGKLVTSYEKFMMGQDIARKTMKDLRVAAVETYATFPQLTEIFQQAIGQTQSMGTSFGETVDEINKNTVKLAQRLSNVAGAIGMPMDRVREEIRSMLSGNASTDSLISTLIFGSPSEANAAIRKAKDAGANGVKDLLDKMLAPFDALEGVESLTRSMLRFQGAWEGAMMDMSQPVFQDLAPMFDDFAKSITSNSTEIASDFKAIYETAKVLAGYTDDVLVAFTLWKTIPPIVKGVAAASDLAAVSQKAYTGSLTGTTFAQKRLLASTVALGRAAKATAVTFAPMLAFLVAYEAYNYLIADQADEEERLQGILAKKLDGIEKLTLAQTKYNLALLEAKKEEQRTAKTETRLAAMADPTNLAKASAADTAQQAYRETSKLVQEYRKEVVVKEKQAEVNARINATLKERGELLTKFQIDSKLVAQREKENFTLQEKILRFKAEIAKNDVAILGIEKLINNTRDEALKKEAGSKKKILEDNSALYQKKINDELNKQAVQRLRDENEYARQVIRTRNAIDEVNGLEHSNVELLQQQVTEEFDILGITKGKLATLKQREKAYDAVLKFMQAVTAEEAKSDAKVASRAKKGMGHTATAVGTQFSEGQFNTATASVISEYTSAMARINDVNGQAAKDLETKFIDAMTAINDKFVASEQEWSDTLTENTISALDGQIALIEATKDWTDGLDGVAGAYASIADSIAAVNVLELKSEKERIKLTKKRDAAIKEARAKGKDTAEIEATYQKNLDQLKYQSTQNQLDAYGQIAGAMGSMYEEGTKQAKAFEGIQRALAIISGVTAILEQAKGDPYTSFGRMAYMAATVASTLAIAGISFAGGQTGPSVSQDAFAAQAANTGVGSVLGDASAQSESIANSLDILERFAEPQFAVLAQMRASLISIDQKLGGVSAQIVRAGGFAVGEGFLNTSTVGDQSAVVDYFTEAFKIGTGSKLLDKIAGVIGVPGGAGAIDKLVNSIFGGASSTTLADAGLKFDPQSLSDALDNLSGTSYQVIKVSTDGGWLYSDTETYSTIFDKLDSEVTTQFSLVLANMFDTVVAASDVLGVEASGLLDNFTVELGKISLSGKTGDQIQETLTAVFGKVFDEMAGAAVDNLGEFQRIGEGLGETLVRVATGMQEAKYYTDRLGSAFDEVSYDQIVNKEGEVGLEALRQSIRMFDEAMYGAANGVVTLLDGVTDSAASLYSMYQELSSIRDQLMFIGQGSNALTGSMVIGAGSLGDLQTGLSDFFDNFLTDGERMVFETQQLSAEFARFGVTMPTSAAAFRTLIESIDTTTSAGQELYGRMITLSGSFSDLTGTIEDYNDTILSAQSDLAAAWMSSYSPLTAIQKASYADTLAMQALSSGNLASAIDTAKIALEAKAAIVTTDEQLALSFVDYATLLQQQLADATNTDIVNAQLEGNVLLDDLITKVESIQQALPA